MDVSFIFPARSILGEGALWSSDEQALYWIDQMRPELHRFDPCRGVDKRIEIDLPDQLGGIGLRRGGGLVLSGSDGVSLIDPQLTRRRSLVNPIDNAPWASFNDAKCDRQGRLWTGTTDRMETEISPGLFRIEGDGSASLCASGFIGSNGPSFSPDGKRLYHTRSHERLLEVWDLNPESGEIANPRPLARFDPALGYPDGTAVDADGFIWLCHFGGWRLTRLDPEGAVDRIVEMPVRAPASCAFGGPDFKTLYVTTASIEFRDGEWLYLDEAGFAAKPMEGGLFAIATEVPGLPEPYFAG